MSASEEEIFQLARLRSHEVSTPLPKFLPRISSSSIAREKFLDARAGVADSKLKTRDVLLTLFGTGTLKREREAAAASLFSVAERGDSGLARRKNNAKTPPEA